MSRPANNLTDKPPHQSAGSAVTAEPDRTAPAGQLCAAAGNCGACVLREICHRGAQRAPTNSSHGGQSDAQ